MGGGYILNARTDNTYRHGDTSARRPYQPRVRITLAGADRQVSRTQVGTSRRDVRPAFSRAFARTASGVPKVMQSWSAATRWFRLWTGRGRLGEASLPGSFALWAACRRFYRTGNQPNLTHHSSWGLDSAGTMSKGSLSERRRRVRDE